MANPAAPGMAAYRVSQQKSAEGIVVPDILDEGLNAEMSEAIL